MSSRSTPGEATVDDKTETSFNPPPNWPLPRDFSPPPGWQPDPSWPAPPAGWLYWVTTDKKRPVLRTIVLVVLSLVLCGVTGYVALVAGGADTRANQAVQTPVTACSGQTYPDQQPDNDVCADAAGTVVLHDVAITVTPLRRDPADRLCSDLTYLNQSDRTVTVNPHGWQVRSPGGELRGDVPAGPGGLGVGEVVRGGTRSGTICFEPVSGGGTFATIYQPSGPGHQRGVWLTTIQ